MGCCCSCCCPTAPTADVYLSVEMTPPTADPLLPGMPNASVSNHYPLILVGGGPPCTVTVVATDETTQLLKINLPPRQAFGIGANVTDAAGTPVAWLRSAHASRQFGHTKSSYNIFAARPRAGTQQAPVAVDAQGSAGFLWGVVTRKPFSNTHTVTDANGVHLFNGKRVRGFDTKGMQTWLMETPAGVGVAHVSRRKGAKPPLHDIRVAAGGDPAFALCVMYAATLATDELYQDHSSHDDGNYDA